MVEEACAFYIIILIHSGAEEKDVLVVERTKTGDPCSVD